MCLNHYVERNATNALCLLKQGAWRDGRSPTWGVCREWAERTATTKPLSQWQPTSLGRQGGVGEGEGEGVMQRGLSHRKGEARQHMRQKGHERKRGGRQESMERTMSEERILFNAILHSGYWKNKEAPLSTNKVKNLLKEYHKTLDT